jgi:regulatory protein
VPAGNRSPARGVLTMSGFQRRGFGGRKKKPPEEPANPDAARQKAIGLLARRDFGSKELKGRLARAGYEAGAAESAVEDLQDERLVDDARYVEHAVASRAARGQGPVRITLELKRLGIAPDLVTQAVDPRSAEWGERAANLRRRRFGAAPPEDAKERTRQVRFLLYRGFTSAHVREALGRAADDLADGDLDDAELALGDGDSPDEAQDGVQGP